MTVYYCTKEQVKTACDIQGTSDDGWIDNDVIPEAQSQIESYLGRSFQPAVTEVRYFDGNGADFLVVGEVSSVTAVSVNTVDVTTDVVIGPYNRSPGYKLVRLTGQWDEGRKNVSVAASWGNPTVPEWLSRITLRLAVHWVKMRDTSYADSMSEQGAVRQKYSKQMPTDIREVLDYQRRVGVVGRS